MEDAALLALLMDEIGLEVEIKFGFEAAQSLEF